MEVKRVSIFLLSGKQLSGSVLIRRDSTIFAVLDWVGRLINTPPGTLLLPFGVELFDARTRIDAELADDVIRI